MDVQEALEVHTKGWLEVTDRVQEKTQIPQDEDKKTYPKVSEADLWWWDVWQDATFLTPTAASSHNPLPYPGCTSGIKLNFGLKM